MEDEFLADLASDDEATVIRALHAACPCTGSDERYTVYMDVLHRLKKDPRPKVRGVAIHLDGGRRDDLRANHVDAFK